MILNFIHTLFTLYNLLILMRILSSWIPEMENAEWMQFVKKMVDPYLNIFRRIIPPVGMMDFSPIVALIALQLLETCLILLIRS